MSNYPELEVCGRCGEHTSFTLDEYGDWLSECCSARAMPVDVEPLEGA